MNDPTPKVFLDTGVFKSAIRQQVFGKLVKIRDPEGNVIGGHVPIVERNYNDNVIDADDRNERNLVEKVAKLAYEGVIEAVTSHEVVSKELMHLPKTFPTSGGIFHGAPWKIVRCPIPLGYSVTAPKSELRGFIESIDDKRFLEIRKQVGAYQGEKSAPINQLFDALFIWTAECAGCKYFLTIEKKLPKFDLRSKTMLCLQPSELLAIFQ